MGARHRATVVAMTAHAMVDEREKCIDAGMDDYLSKPIDPDKLYAILFKWIKPGERVVSLPHKKPFGNKVEIMLPEELPGIDLQDALRRVGGNQNLLFSLLSAFCRDHRSTAAAIKLAIRGNDSELAERTAHTVKGLAGNLSASQLRDAAAILEENIRKGHIDHIDDVLAAFDDKLNVVIQSIEGMMKQEKVVVADKQDIPFDLALVKPLIGRLEGMLAANDLAAFDSFAEIKEHLSTEKFSEELNQLEQFIEMGAFSKARVILTVLSDKLNIK